MITCSECKGKVSDNAYVCPHCGRDVRALKANGHNCHNCDWRVTCNVEDDWKGPAGYPCLEYVEEY